MSVSISRFRSAHSRQIALWILRALSSAEAKRKFLRDDWERGRRTEIAEFLGLSEPERTERGFKRADLAEQSDRMDQLLRALESTDLPVGPKRRPRCNVEKLGAVLALNCEERRVLEFYVCFAAEPILKGVWIDFRKRNVGKQTALLARILALPAASIGKVLDFDAPLVRCGLLFQGEGEGEGDAAADEHNKLGSLFYQRYDEDALIVRFGVKGTAAPELDLQNFPYLKDSLEVLVAHLDHSRRVRRRGVNVLLHGPPGTGKTQLSRIVGRALGLSVFDIATDSKSDGPVTPRNRLFNLEFGDTFLSNRAALLVFDEAEDVFESSLAARSEASAHKASFNQRLERNRCPIIWICNRTRGLDPAFVRRFDVVMEVPVPPRGIRRQIVQSMVGDLIDDGLKDKIAATPTIAPALVARAGEVIRGACRGLSTAERGKALTRLLSGTLRAQRCPDPFLRRSRLEASAETYDLQFLNPSHDLASIAEKLKSHSSARLCLHGPPGTGKTLFGHWLSEELERPLVEKKASDLLGPFVGMTEGMIAEAFEEATREDAILLLDEVDSFLAMRSRAHRSWEVTAVNEMLTQIESYEGIMLASTNRVDALDTASLRRFDLVVRFDYLRPDQLGAILDAHCRSLGLPEPGEEVLDLASRLEERTPGDFAAAARRHRFDPFPDAKALVEAVREDVALRNRSLATIGFAQG